MAIRSLIIDDDPFIKDLLKDKIEQFIPDVKIVETASNGQEGMQKIDVYRPDLVFLDVEMEDMTGFEMLSKLDEINFETIFITSYVHYAIKAIRFNALDYLVKPIDLGELKTAIGRYKEKVKDNAPGSDVKNALANMKVTKNGEQKLTLQTQDGTLRMKLINIVRMEGERNYTYIYMSEGKKHLVSKTLGEFEEMLDDKGFFRCHKSHIVNFHHIDDYSQRDKVTMSDQSEIAVARRKKDEFREWFEGY